MFILNEKTKANISRKTGISFEEIPSLDFSKIDELIETKTGKKLEYDNVTDKRLIGRGSVYLALSRFLGMKEIDRALLKI